MTAPNCHWPVPSPMDEKKEREAFEDWASATPREFDLTRYSAQHPWPKAYRDYHVQCAWEAWLARGQYAAENPPTPREDIKLNIIRDWPDGMALRVEEVWRDLVGFSINYKLYDLQRCLAEFGFTMKIYDDTPAKKEVDADEKPTL